MANLNELLIGLGYAVQASISTAPTTPGYWRLPNLNKKPWSQKVVNDDDRTEIGKGHEFPTQQWKSHYDNGTYTVERPASSEILAHALGFGLGSVVVTGSAAPYTYTITPINPATNSTGLELPYFQFVQQIRPGGSAVLDQLFAGCAVKGWKLAGFDQCRPGAGTPERGRYRGPGAQRALHDAERRHDARAPFT